MFEWWNEVFKMLMKTSVLCHTIGGKPCNADSHLYSIRSNFGAQIISFHRNLNSFSYICQWMNEIKMCCKLISRFCQSILCLFMLLLPPKVRFRLCQFLPTSHNEQNRQVLHFSDIFIFKFSVQHPGHLSLHGPVYEKSNQKYQRGLALLCAFPCK